jgi:5'-phosphate synthase pdxT subunit
VVVPAAAAAPGLVGVLALQGDFREHVRLLSHLGATSIEVRVPADLARVTSLVFPGGESTTMSLLLESSGLFGPLRERLADGMPAFGTCAGMIMLAREILDGRPDQHHFGAIDISVRRNAFGRQRDSFEADLAVAGMPVPMHAVFIRAPVVERAGPDVQVLASVRTVGGEEKPVVCRQGPVLVSSFHPELVGETRLHELFLQYHRFAARDGRLVARERPAKGSEGSVKASEAPMNAIEGSMNTRKENVRAL